MVNIKRVSISQVFCYCITVLWVFALLFPVIWMISSSMKTSVEVYKTPPKLIPDLKKEIDVRLDYTEINLSDMELKEVIKYDIVNIVWGTSIKFNNENIGAVRIIATEGNKKIAESYTPSYNMKIAQIGRVYATSAEPVFFAPVMDQLFAFTSTKYYFDDSFDFKPVKYLERDQTSNSVYDFFKNYDLKGKLISVGERKSFIRLFDSYIFAWKGAASQSVGQNISFGKFIFNSIYVTFMGVLGSLIISSLAGYSMSKLLKPQYARYVLIIFLATLMVPGMLTVIPLFELFNKLNLFNTYIVLYLGAWFAPITIYFFKGFFDGLPKELFESAKLDGANNAIIFVRIVLPLSGPVFGAMAIMQFIPMWNSFLWPFLVTQDPQMYTMPVALYRIQRTFLSAPNDIMALSIISCLPTIIVFLLFQKAIQKGIVFSGIKG